ncbi:MAG: amidohydrolase family protein [Rhizobiales bacterium]|mgnify:CR=1 FL=1|nr:amidohydrolase family protein [Hyphomicrobiales bacterium]OJY43076.1 MAG: cytosine deaminase [Rhizobiales bacterium 64-17]
MARILIKGGSIVTMDPAIKDLPRGDILIENGKIAAVRPTIAADGAEVIDAAQMIVLPGLINSHVHTWQSALRGVAADWTVAKYMQSMHRGLAGHFRPEDLYIANLMGALNQLHCGATTLVDWCHSNRTPEHTDAAIQGLTESGARAVFLHGSPKPDPKPGQPHFSEVPMPRSEIERLRKGRFASDDGLVTFGLAILGPYYSIYDVSRTDMALAREFDLIASMHVSGGSALTPDGFKRLLAEGLIGPKTNIVHGNDMDLADVRAIAAKGASFSVTAEIELQMGYGDPLTGVLMECGAPVSIGSDVEPSARGDMFTAMRVTLQHERNRRIVELGETEAGKPLEMPITVRHALEWATINGARMAGLDHKVGSLTPGKEADVLLLRASDINMQPVWDPVASSVMQAGVTNVDTVLVAGRVVKRGGQLLYADLARKAQALRASGERILTDFGLLPKQAA